MNQVIETSLDSLENKLLFHHCIDIKYAKPEKIINKPEYAEDYLQDPHSWLQHQVGFYPIFLAAGNTQEDIRMTGYQNQWQRIISSKYINDKRVCEYEKPGEFDNFVLFSYKNLEGVFLDYDRWVRVLNSSYNGYNISNYYTRIILKPSWPKSKWLRKARNNPHSVMFVTNKLELDKSDRIWVRNKSTKKILEKRGFDKNIVQVKRIKLDPW
ncbi:hypothetical protein HOK51_02235 [Candidatus Woesearchaeota archaeon]|jgi:hypothetical protein|nr:hypothetical protein [Candidatus Woesearchaeota archaeon]MBT6518635.1 hypothetical protein [Candidatus Woesearchaeota archaeon]MBT7368040.1 hypothetical protein [Candidatus Woesearchaeota archaeon]